MANKAVMIKSGVILFAVGGTLLLSACSGASRPSVAYQTPAPVITPAPAPRPNPEPKPEVVTESPKESPKAETVQQPPEAAEQVQTARVETAPAPKPAPRPVTPPPPPPPTMHDVLNLDRSALTDMLLAPRLKRQEAPAEVWQYIGQTCVLHVFFYPSVQDSQLSVDHLEATSPTGAKYPTNSCLAELVTAKAREP